MGCIAITGYAKGCDSSYGGIKKVAIYEKAALSWYGVVAGVVTGLTINTTGYTGYTFDFLKDNSNWTEPIVGDGITATVHWTPTITLVFRRMSAALRNQIMELSKGDLVFLIKDYNNICWIIGTDRGMQLAASAGGASGNLLEELNGETLVFTGSETYKAYEFNLTTVSAAYPISPILELKNA